MNYNQKVTNNDIKQNKISTNTSEQLSKEKMVKVFITSESMLHRSGCELFGLVQLSSVFLSKRTCFLCPIQSSPLFFFSSMHMKRHSLGIYISIDGIVNK